MKPEPVPWLGQGADELVTLHYLGAAIGRPPCLPSACHQAKASLLGPRACTSLLLACRNPGSPGIPALVQVNTADLGMCLFLALP